MFRIVDLANSSALTQILQLLAQIAEQQQANALALARGRQHAQLRAWLRKNVLKHAPLASYHLEGSAESGRKRYVGQIEMKVAAPSEATISPPWSTWPGGPPAAPSAAGRESQHPVSEVEVEAAEPPTAAPAPMIDEPPPFSQWPDVAPSGVARSTRSVERVPRRVPGERRLPAAWRVAAPARSVRVPFHRGPVVARERGSEGERRAEAAPRDVEATAAPGTCSSSAARPVTAACSEGSAVSGADRRARADAPASGELVPIAMTRERCTSAAGRCAIAAKADPAISPDRLFGDRRHRAPRTRFRVAPQPFRRAGPAFGSSRSEGLSQG